jgi:hypothetical protein
MKLTAQNPEDMALMMFKFRLLILYNKKFIRKLLHVYDHCV